jgi:hypothetical protein
MAAIDGGGAIAIIYSFGARIIRSSSSYLLSMSFFYLSFSTLRRDCTSRQNIRRGMIPTISRLAIERVHVEHDIVDAVHGINGWWLVAVTDGICKLFRTCFVVITSLAH